MTKPIDAPRQFFRLARAFDQGSRAKVQNEQEWIASALKHLDDHGRDVVKKFLTETLDQNPDEADLQKLWNSAGSNYYIVGHKGYDGVRHFLTMIKDQID